MSLLWMTIEPRQTETRLQLSAGAAGLCLRARLPVCPQHSRALAQLLQALVAWYGRPLTAVLDADAQDVAAHPERWALLLGDLDAETIRVDWVHFTRAAFRRDRFMDGLGSFARARRLVRGKYQERLLGLPHHNSRPHTESEVEPGPALSRLSLLDHRSRVSASVLKGRTGSHPAVARTRAATAHPHHRRVRKRAGALSRGRGTRPRVPVRHHGRRPGPRLEHDSISWPRRSGARGTWAQVEIRRSD